MVEGKKRELSTWNKNPIVTSSDYIDERIDGKYKLMLIAWR